MRAALSHRAFRRVFAGTLASNVGTWMQNVILIEMAYRLTKGGTFIGVVTFAQLGPMLFLSPVGGFIADRVNRRVMMVAIAGVQAALSLVLAALATQDTPSRSAIVGVVALIGIASAVNAPAAAATLPSLVGRADLRGAVALNSASMNASRVVGPVLGGLVALAGGAPAVFCVNAATYLFVIIALVTAHADFSPRGRTGESPLRQLSGGFREARLDPVVRNVLLTIAVFSLFSLVFIYQLPKIAGEQFGLEDVGYTLLFSTFGSGALVGALAMGSVFSGRPRQSMVRSGLAVFAASLTTFAAAPGPWIGFPAIFVTGASYFVIVTALVTTLQLRVHDDVRGRVLGLWTMAWAGLVPVGGLIGGIAVDRVGTTAVLLFGAAVAAVLAALVDIDEGAAAPHGDGDVVGGAPAGTAAGPAAAGAAAVSSAVAPTVVAMDPTEGTSAV
jgi:predicted MFS family arabinose efflux permease